jgi:hypothetical protein
MYGTMSNKCDKRQGNDFAIKDCVSITQSVARTCLSLARARRPTKSSSFGTKLGAKKGGVQTQVDVVKALLEGKRVGLFFFAF